jgi:hypothetical protein
MVSCPGRGAASFTLLRRAGTDEGRQVVCTMWTPDQQRIVKDAALHPGNAGYDPITPPRRRGDIRRPRRA